MDKISDKKYQVNYIKTGELVPFDRNPKKHPEKQIEKLMKSMGEFGWTNPILAIKHEGKNLVIAGHARLEGANKLNLSEVPVIFLDIPYEKAIAYNIADNKIAELAEWDNDILKEILMEIKDDKDLLASIGFEDDELHSLLGEEIVPGEEDFDAEKALEKQKFKVESGDVFQIGNHRLLCGDSTKEEDVKKLMNEKKAKMVFTDPPYGVDYSGGRQQLQHKKINEGKIKNDSLSIEEFNKFLKESFKQINQNTTENASIYVCHGDSKLKPLKTFLEIWDSIGWHHANEIIWRKNVASLGYCDYRYIHECISYGWKGKDHYNAKDLTEVDVWEISRDAPQKYLHVTQKPIELSMRAIKNSSKREEIVLDLFGGSGSTLIASEQLKRNCYMMELDHKYCSVILERFINYKKHYGDVFKLNKDGSKTPVKELENEKE